MAGLIKKELGALATELRAATKAVGFSFGVLWLIQTINWIGGHWLNVYGVIPRTTVGLWGLLTMPFLHDGWGHLLANTIAGVPLAFMAMERRRRDFFIVAGVSALTGGLMAWLLGGTGTVHVGASGVVFGLMGFLLARGFVERRAGPIIMSVLVAFFYGGSMFSMLPFLYPGISWQGHLGGFLGGLLVAKLLGGKGPAKPKAKD